MAKPIQGESKLTFFEATSIIVGHGVGSGILSVPYLAAHNSLREILLIAGFCYLFNLVLHLIIAELSYNNGGAQFIRCLDAELFSGRIKKILTWAAFLTLGMSVISTSVPSSPGPRRCSAPGWACPMRWGCCSFMLWALVWCSLA